MLAGFTSHLALAIAACIVGSAFQHGYNTGVVNAPQDVIEEFINQTQLTRNERGFKSDELTIVWSLTVAVFCVGGMIGGVVMSPVAEHFGRRKSLLYNNFLITISVILIAFSYYFKSYEMLIVARFITGICAGMNAGLAPMYLNEIAPIHLRGAIGGTYQLMFTTSVLVSEILGLPQCFGTSERWPLLLGLILIPALTQILTLIPCPESPKFTFMKTKDKLRTEKDLQWLRNSDDVRWEMQLLQSEIDNGNRYSKVTLRELFVNKMYRTPLIISIIVMLSQQLTGINSVIGYSTDIFHSAGLSHSSALTATLIMGTVNVLMTLISLWLVEFTGRRTLYIMGLAGLLIITSLLTVCLAFKDESPSLKFASVWLLFLFVVVFASCVGCIPWIIVFELFDQRSRSLACSVAVPFNWLANFSVVLTFLPLKNILGIYVFTLFAGFNLCFLIFSILWLPETKNKTTEEIQASFLQWKSKNPFASTVQLFSQS